MFVFTNIINSAVSTKQQLHMLAPIIVTVSHIGGQRGDRVLELIEGSVSATVKRVAILVFDRFNFCLPQFPLLPLTTQIKILKRPKKEEKYDRRGSETERKKK